MPGKIVLLRARYLAFLTFLSVASCAVLLSCGGGSTSPSSSQQQQPPPAISVTVTPGTANLTVGGTQQFQDTVSNTSNTTVTWAVNGVAGGNSSLGTISSTGTNAALYTAPDPIPPSGSTLTINATSQADSSKSGSATVSLVYPAPTVSNLSQTSLLVGAGNSTLTVTGTGFSKASVANFNGTTLSTTYVSSSVLNATVPASALATASTANITVTNPAPAGGTSGTVALTVGPVVVFVSPSLMSLVAGQTQQFTAAVTGASNTAVNWTVNGVPGGNSTLGTVDTTGRYSAPDLAPVPAQIAIAATSQADPTKSTSATITIVAALRVVSTLPQDGATDVTVTTPIRMQFNQPLDQASIAMGAIVLSTGGTRIPTKASYDSSTQTVSITTTGVLSIGTTYSVTIGIHVSSTLGSVMPSLFSFSFTTSSPTTVMGALVPPTNTSATSFSVISIGQTSQPASDGTFTAQVRTEGVTPLVAITPGAGMALIAIAIPSIPGSATMNNRETARVPIGSVHRTQWQITASASAVNPLSGLALDFQTTAESLAYMSFQLFTSVQQDAEQVMSAIASDPTTKQLANDLAAAWNQADPVSDPTVLNDLLTIQLDLAGQEFGVAGVASAYQCKLSAVQQPAAGTSVNGLLLNMLDTQFVNVDVLPGNVLQPKVPLGCATGWLLSVHQLDSNFPNPSTITVVQEPGGNIGSPGPLPITATGFAPEPIWIEGNSLWKQASISALISDALNFLSSGTTAPAPSTVTLPSVPTQQTAYVLRFFSGGMADPTELTDDIQGTNQQDLANAQSLWTNARVLNYLDVGFNYVSEIPVVGEELQCIGKTSVRNSILQHLHASVETYENPSPQGLADAVVRVLDDIGSGITGGAASCFANVDVQTQSGIALVLHNISTVLVKTAESAATIYSVWLDSANFDQLKDELSFVATPVDTAVVIAPQLASAAPPATPTLTSPPNGSQLPPGTSSVTLQWSTVTGAYAYDVELDTGSCGGTFVTGLSTKANSFNMSVTAGRTYYWRVKSSGNGGTSSYSNCFSFATPAVASATLPAPTLLTPANGATGVSPTMTPFSWSAVNGADAGYRIMVATSASVLPRDASVDTCTGCAFNDTTAAGVTSWTPPTPLAAATFYYWQVHARSSGGGGTWSNIYSFTTVRTPTVSGTVPTMPTVSSSAQPLTINGNYFQSGATVSFTPTVGGTFWVTPSSVTTTAIQVSVTLNQSGAWALLAKNSDSGMSIPYGFTVAAATLPAPTLSAPLNGATGVSTAPTFSWTNVIGNAGYRIMVATTSSALPTDPTASTCASCVINATTSTSVTSYTPSTALSEGTPYYWEVHALTPASNPGYGTWSSIYSFTTQTTWPHTWGGSAADSAAAIARDTAGNIYVAGATQSFGAGGSDVLLLKYNAAGTLLWTKTWGGSATDYATAVAVDSAGGVYVTGGTDSFSAGWRDVFLLKFDGSGNLLWSKTWGGFSYDVGHDIAFDIAGNVFVAAETYSFRPPSAESSASAVLKFTPSGDLLWSHVWTSGLPAVTRPVYDGAYSLDVDGNGNIIFVGITWDYNVTPLHNSIAIVKLDSSGNLIWNRNWAGPSEDEAWGTKVVRADGHGNIYVAGRTASQCLSSNFSTCDFDVLLLKLDANGQFVWSRTWKPSTGYDTAFSLDFDGSSNVVLTGAQDQYGPTATALLLRFDPSGNLLSGLTWSGGPGAVGSAVLVDATSNIFVAGNAPNNVGSWKNATGSTGTENGTLSTQSSSVASVSVTLRSPSGTLTSPAGVTDTGGGGQDVFISMIPVAAPATTSKESPPTRSGED